MVWAEQLAIEVCIQKYTESENGSCMPFDVLMEWVGYAFVRL